MRSRSAIVPGLWAAASLAWVLPPPLPAQPVTLDEQGLDRVTAATPESWRPPVSGPTIVVMADAASLSTAVVSLEDDGQAGARALNLVNAAGADSAQGVNISDLGASSGAGTGGLVVEQRNEIAQSAESFALLGSFDSPGGLVEQFRMESGTASEAARSMSRLVRIDRSISAQTVTTRLSAEIDPEFVGLFDTPVSLGGREISLPDFEIDFLPFDVDFDFGDSWIADLFEQVVNVTLNIAALDVEGASLRLGDVTFDGNDVIISGPQLTMPSLSFTFCFVNRGCSGENGGDPVTVTVGGRTFNLDPITLTDANPLGDLGMSFGYAVAGDGTITFEAGGVEVVGSIALDLGELTGLSFSIDIPEIGPLSGFMGSLELPTFEIPIDLAVDFPQPSFADREIGGQACVFDDGLQQCTPLDRTVETFEERTFSTDETHITESERSEERQLVTLERSRGDLSVEHGQADVVVLRDAELTDRRYRLVIVGGNAQSGVRAANLVNSATAIVGSGLNLNAERIGERQTGGAFESSLSQTNSFHQVGGL